MAKYDLKTPVNELFSNEKTLNVLKEALPKLVDSPQAAMLKGLPMPLEQIFAFMGGKIGEDKIKLLEEKLAEITD